MPGSIELTDKIDDRGDPVSVRINPLGAGHEISITTIYGDAAMSIEAFAEVARRVIAYKHGTEAVETVLRHVAELDPKTDGEAMRKHVEDMRPWITEPCKAAE